MPGVNTYHITMDDEKLEVKAEILFKMYGVIEAKAKEIAPQNINNGIRISQDARIKSKFYIVVSDMMAQHLISAIQHAIDAEYGMGLKSYFHKLQEQIMAQMFGPQEHIPTFDIKYEGNLL